LRREQLNPGRAKPAGWFSARYAICLQLFYRRKNKVLIDNQAFSFAPPGISFPRPLRVQGDNSGPAAAEQKNKSLIFSDLFLTA
ncbi:MAG: hypothetical protein IK008_04075, partial [Bacteroidales bacterium]|nr:hypothetical protein [Bacteroidales bacterium]